MWRQRNDTPSITTSNRTQSGDDTPTERENRQEVGLATLAWIEGYNNRRLLERVGHIPPAEAEKAYYAAIGNGVMAA